MKKMVFLAMASLFLAAVEVWSQDWQAAKVDQYLSRCAWELGQVVQKKSAERDNSAGLAEEAEKAKIKAEAEYKDAATALNKKRTELRAKGVPDEKLNIPSHLLSRYGYPEGQGPDLSAFDSEIVDATSKLGLAEQRRTGLNHDYHRHLEDRDRAAKKAQAHTRMKTVYELLMNYSTRERLKERLKEIDWEEKRHKRDSRDSLERDRPLFAALERQLATLEAEYKSHGDTDDETPYEDLNEKEMKDLGVALPDDYFPFYRGSLDAPRDVEFSQFRQNGLENMQEWLEIWNRVGTFEGLLKEVVGPRFETSGIPWAENDMLSDFNEAAKKGMAFPRSKQELERVISVLEDDQRRFKALEAEQAALVERKEAFEALLRDLNSEREFVKTILKTGPDKLAQASCFMSLDEVKEDSLKKAAAQSVFLQRQIEDILGGPQKACR